MLVLYINIIFFTKVNLKSTAANTPLPHFSVFLNAPDGAKVTAILYGCFLLFFSVMIMFLRHKFLRFILRCLFTLNCCNELPAVSNEPVIKIHQHVIALFSHGKTTYVE